MATENVVVVVSEKGAAQTADAIKKVGTSASTSGSAVDALNRGLAGLGAAFSINKLKEAADSYSGLYARLRLVSKGNEDLIATEKRLFAISQETRSSFEGTAALYTKLSLNAKNLNISQEKIAQTVSLTNKAIILSGASANEAKGGLIQFSQGLASGKLQGEELRSVLENLPFLANQIAKGLNTTVDNLRKLGATGQLTTAQVLQALDKQRSEIEKGFESFTPTISQSIQILENAFTRFIGQADQASGASKVIGSAITLLANNLDVLADSILTAGAAFAAFKVATFIQGIYASVTAVGAFNAILAVNPFVAFATVLAAVSIALVTFGDQIKLSADGTITLATVAKKAFGEVWEAIKKAAVAVYDFGKSIIDGIGSAITWFSDLLGWINKTISALGRLGKAQTDVQTQRTSTGGESTSGFDIPSSALNGFAKGGKFTVGGSGGTDSQLVQFLASPNERVIVQTPRQQNAGLAAFASGGSFGGDVSTGFARVLTSDRTEQTFSQATESGTKGGFTELNSTTAAVSRDTLQGSDRVYSGVQSIGGTISTTVIQSANANNATFKAGTDGTTSAVNNVNASIGGLGSALGSIATAIGRSGGRSGGEGFTAGSSSSTGGGGSVALGKGFSASIGSGGGFFAESLRSAADLISAVGGNVANLDQNPVLAKAANLIFREITRRQIGASSQAEIQQREIDLKNTLRSLLTGQDGSLVRDTLGNYASLAGFRSGGSMTVGGTGAVDSTLLGIKASKGERIDVLTAAQQQEQRKAANKPSQIRVEINVNGVTDLASFRRSEGQVLRKFAGQVGKALQNV
jgi:tape measure domain-containing protein